MSNDENKTLEEIDGQSDNIHINKTTDTGSKVDINIDKDNKEVEINIDNTKKAKGKENGRSYC